ncbi:zonadhesin-like [Tachypleus tridentatus]|uniref:zonadhesin-like n=1 Tax=Tachypleus tridentatus TaxID=6853 RepID=UPI003FD2562E
MGMISSALLKLVSGLFQLSFIISRLTVLVEGEQNVVVGGSGYSCTNLEDGAYVDYQKGCRGFFICKSGKKNEFWCANGTLFNSSSGCDSSSYVRCVAPKQNVSHFLVEDCSQQEDGVYTSYSADCRKFYFCRDGRKVEFSCPPGRRFDWKKGSCGLSEKVSCKRLDCHGMVDGVYADFTEACRRYFLCVRGEIQEFSCPAGKAFDENLRICIDAQETECGRAQELNCHELPDGYYPVYEKNCQAFQVCENGILRKYFCPPPMMFSPESLSCAYPKQELVCELPLSTLCKQNGNGIYPRFDRDCREFIICKDGYLIQSGFCTHGKLFDQVTETCQLPSQVVCNSFKDLDCDGRLDGAYPLKGSRCSAFYVCINQKIILQSTCPFSTLFDSTSELCLPSKVAECAVLSIAPTTISFHWDISHYGCDGRLGLYADFLSGCRRFYICAYGQRYISKCPRQQKFSQVTGQCEDDEVDCYAPKLLGTFLCNHGSDGIYVDVKSNCKRWHECWGEKGATYSCPAGETFNSISRACDSSGETTCGYVVAQSYQSPNNLPRVINAIPVAEAGFDCNGKRNGVFALGERDCGLFHICSNDRTFSFMCPSNMAYNPVLKSCEDPTTFICKKTDNRNTHQTDFSCIFRVDGYYPDTDMNCKRYFICRYGKRTTVYCPDGYLFNTLTANCEYDIIENIQCKSTVTTEKFVENTQNHTYSPLDIQTGEMATKHTSMCKECSHEITHKSFYQHSHKHHSETHPPNVATTLQQNNNSGSIFNKWYQPSKENKESTVVVNSHKSRSKKEIP